MTDYPEAHTAEACALSCMMRGGGDVRRQATRRLRSVMFDRYRDLSDVVLEIAKDTRPDADTVRTRYDGSRLDEVLEQRPAPQNIPRFIDDIREAYGSRLVLDRVFTAASDVRDRPFLEVATNLESDVIDITEEVGEGEAADVSDILGSVLKDLEDEQGKRITGVPSGLPKIDKMTRGFQEGDLVIPFGSTSMGKTSFALTCALHAAKEGYGVAIHSLEMPKKQLGRRLITMETGIDLRQTTIPDHQWQKIARAAGKISDLTIRIEESSALDPIQHRARLRHLDHEVGIDLAVVDYLQLMKPTEPKNRRHAEIHDAAQGLKDTAKLVGCAVVTPSQTTKGPDHDERSPSLSDLREAGEEPADTAIGLYRPEYYGVTTDERGESTEGIGQAIIAKQRNGPTGAARLAFVKERALWQPLASEVEHSGDGTPF